MPSDFQRRAVSEKDVPPHIKARIQNIQKEHADGTRTYDQTEYLAYVNNIKKSADSGNVDNQVKYADIFLYGLFGFSASPETAAKYYAKAAKSGNVEAQARLADCYFDGKGVAQNYSEAAKWYGKAADQGYAYAKTYLEICHQIGGNS